MPYEIVLDNREHKLIDFFSDSKVSQLDIGDILYVNTDSNETVCIIERKTLDDLSSSIIDGRYKEQKQRLLASGIKVIYIIEGLAKNSHGVKYSTLQSAILNMQLRDNITVIKTKNIEETSHIIVMLKDKLQFLSSSPLDEIKSYNPCISSKKKNNISKELVFENQLACIPGISSKTAKDILHIYPTLKSLILKYHQLTSDKEREHLLCSINGIGPVISLKVYNFLF